MDIIIKFQPAIINITLPEVTTLKKTPNVLSIDNVPFPKNRANRSPGISMITNNKRYSAFFFFELLLFLRLLDSILKDEYFVSLLYVFKQ